MTLAKPPRSPVKDKTQFDTTLENQDFSSVYIQECKSKKLRPDSRSKPKPTSPSQVVLVPDTDEDDVIIMSSSQPPTQAARSVKFKLLQFHENHRPAYYGTVCRRSQLISPRNPFRKDKVCLAALVLVVHVHDMHSAHLHACRLTMSSILCVLKIV